MINDTSLKPGPGAGSPAAFVAGFSIWALRCIRNALRIDALLAQVLCQ